MLAGGAIDNRTLTGLAKFSNVNQVPLAICEFCYWPIDSGWPFNLGEQILFGKPFAHRQLLG